MSGTLRVCECINLPYAWVPPPSCGAASRGRGLTSAPRLRSSGVLSRIHTLPVTTEVRCNRSSSIRVSRLLAHCNHLRAPSTRRPSHTTRRTCNRSRLANTTARRTSTAWRPRQRQIRSAACLAIAAYRNTSLTPQHKNRSCAARALTLEDASIRVPMHSPRKVTSTNATVEEEDAGLQAAARRRGPGQSSRLRCSQRRARG